ncbi:MAG: hypothetical protein ABJG88_10105 [Litorimonas sp.]
MKTALMNIPTITNDGQGASYFSAREIALNGDMSRQLSDQIEAVNFRLRRSESYEAGFHVAGDPTLLIVLSGTMRITLANGEARDFRQGDMYIAQDYLAKGVAFEAGLHGHSAKTIGDVPYNAVHLKLSRLSAA